MRVLIATHFFAADQVGGTEVLTLGLARQLQAAGHDVAVICADDWETAPDSQVRISDDMVQDIPVRRLHFNWMKAPDVFRYLYDNPAAEELTAAYIDEFQPDILHVTSCYSLSGSIVSAARSRGVPVVLTATDFWFVCGRNTLLRSDQTLCCGPVTAWDCTQCMLAGTKIFRLSSRLLPERVAKAGFGALGRRSFVTRRRGLRGMHGNWDERSATLRRFLNEVDLIVTASEYVHQRLIAFGAPAERIVTSAYGLDSSWAAGYSRKTSSPVVRFGFIGQAIPMKGVHILLRAVAAVDRSVDFTLKVYGNLDKDQEYGARLRAIAGEDPRIQFCGTFPNEDMGRILTSIDVLVVPSLWYDFPLVIPSAFATHTPVIATDLPGMNEMVEDGASGFLFERGNWRQLAAILRRLAMQPEMATCLAAGVPAVKSDRQMVAEYVEHYRSLLQGAGAVEALPVGAHAELLERAWE